MFSKIVFFILFVILYIIFIFLQGRMSAIHPTESEPTDVMGATSLDLGHELTRDLSHELTRDLSHELSHELSHDHDLSRDSDDMDLDLSYDKPLNLVNIAFIVGEI